MNSLFFIYARARVVIYPAGDETFGVENNGF